MGPGPFWVEVREDQIIVTKPGTSRVSAYACEGEPTKGQNACKGIYRVEGPSVVVGE
jgi:hypothetical protein